MGGEKEANRSSRQQAEQPRLVAADGAQIAWPEATLIGRSQEKTIFLKANGASALLAAEEEMKRQRANRLSAESSKRWRQKMKKEDPDGYKTYEREKKRLQRAREKLKAEAQEARGTPS
jgi:hypothetical protein